MEDELALDAEAVREDDGAVERAAQMDKPLGRRQVCHLVAANLARDIKHVALNVRRNRAVKTKIIFAIIERRHTADA